jgi:hypothetical protein
MSDFYLTGKPIRRGSPDDNTRLDLGAIFRRLLGATWS